MVDKGNTSTDTDEEDKRKPDDNLQIESHDDKANKPTAILQDLDFTKFNMKATNQTVVQDVKRKADDNVQIESSKDKAAKPTSILQELDFTKFDMKAEEQKEQEIHSFDKGPHTSKLKIQERIIKEKE